MIFKYIIRAGMILVHDPKGSIKPGTSLHACVGFLHRWTMKKVATFDRVSSLLSYDKHGGTLTWLVSRGKAACGSIAGVNWTTQGKWYRVVTIDGRQYFAHRIAWLLHTGEWPKHNIDHIDGNGLNNAIENLRDVPQGENCKNKRPSRRPEKQWGVRWNQGRWQAQIRVAGVVKYLGGFKIKDDAIAARKQAERQFGFHENHGVCESEVV